MIDKTTSVGVALRMFCWRVSSSYTLWQFPTSTSRRSNC